VNPESDAKGFRSLIFGTIVAGIAWMIGAKKLIDWMMNRRKT
jgi:hypothetical protein